VPAPASDATSPRSSLRRVTSSHAGARKDADLAALNTIKNVQAIRLDVTKQEDIDAALATITKAGRGLYGLVNNAESPSQPDGGRQHAE
jgi:NAD(P)-dependent dehydrogenase (short-subunit alcohol dehydrogenase family)